MLSKKSRLLLAALAIFGICALAVALYYLKIASVKFFLRDADARQSAAYNSVAEGSFSDATNQISQYLQFIDQQQVRLSPYRDVAALRRHARLYLCFALLCSDDHSNALYHFRQAYVSHVRGRAEVGSPPVPPGEFPAFVVENITRSSKSELLVNTNTLRIVGDTLAGDI